MAELITKKKSFETATSPIFYVKENAIQKHQEIHPQRKIPHSPGFFRFGTAKKLN